MDAFVVRTKRTNSSTSTQSLDSTRKRVQDTKDDDNPANDAEGTQVSAHKHRKITNSSSPVILQWRRIRAEHLNCDYTLLLSKTETEELFNMCEKNLTYNTGRTAQVQIFGQWRDIPRKQVAFGDVGLSYTFSNNEVPARPWLPFLENIRDKISGITGHRFNFVLINRYEDGNDYMGEHRDDEKDLVRTSPIASLSLGQPRDFVFKHGASRGKNASRQIPTVTVELENGSLLMMNYPTNIYWYHSLPKRKRALGVRINMTFRDFVVRSKP